MLWVDSRVTLRAAPLLRWALLFLVSLKTSPVCPCTALRQDWSRVGLPAQSSGRARWCMCPGTLRIGAANYMGIYGAESRLNGVVI